MSLWHKRIVEITPEDVVNFCKLELEEGPRLDYKQDFTNDKIAKLISAFANTQGGLILFGVGADKKTNKPIRPLTGMQTKPGMSERIVQICQDRIYPPILPQISPVLPNPDVNGTDLMVVRVDEGLEAPYSVDGIVYERTDCLNDRHEAFNPAHIDNIERLLKRRVNVVEARNSSIERESARAVIRFSQFREELIKKYIEHNPAMMESPQYFPPKLPYRWMSVSPVFPWKSLCTVQQCYQFMCGLDVIRANVQRVPGGAYYFQEHRDHISRDWSSCISIGSTGQIYAAETTYESGGFYEPGQGGSLFAVGYKQTVHFLDRHLDICNRFFEEFYVEKPGYLQIDIGLRECLGFVMLDTDKVATSRRNYFMDPDFVTRVVAPYSHLRDDPRGSVAPLISNLRFGFDLPGLNFDKAFPADNQNNRE